MDGPFFHMAGWNPYIREQWDQDEKTYPTFYARVEKLERIGRNARRLQAGDQDRIAQDMIHIVQNDSNPLIRREAVRVLGQLTSPLAAQGLQVALNDGDQKVRLAVIDAWRQRGDSQSVEILARLVGSDTGQDVRMAAMRALAGFKDWRAARALAIALDDSDPAFQHRAIESLKSVTGKDFGGDLVAWRQYVHQGGGGPINETPSIAERLRDIF
jgi:HEAT repeat protein